MNKGKKLLSLLFAMAVLVSLCAMVFAVQAEEVTGGYMPISADTQVDLSLTQDLYVDLNGHDLSGTIRTNGFQVYGMDSATNDYTDASAGCFACVDEQGEPIVPESNVKTDLSGRVMRYVTVAEEEGYSFHRIYLGITRQSLVPAVNGVGYKAEFYADQTVLAQVETIGYDLWLEDGMAVSRSTSFQNQLTLRVEQFDVENHGQTKLYATVWMNIGGQTITSSQYSLTLRQLVETVNANASAFSQEQLQALREMIAANAVMQTWQVENILKQNSVELVTATFADVQLVNVHLGSIVNGPKALRDHLTYVKSIGADVLFMPGDIVNNADQSYYDRFWSIFKSVYGEDESQWPEFVWAMGNHEWYDMSEKDAADAIAMFKANANIESENLVKMSQVPSEANPGQTVANYYKVIEGVPFVVISGDSRANTVTDAQKAELISWLDEINQLPSVKAGAPIYVAYHLPIADVTYFGQGAGEGSRVVDAILKNYPNTVVFTGDTHCPGINERTINQIDYTSINLGSSSYSRMINRSATSQPGDKYYNVGGNNAKDIVNGEVAFGYEYTPNLMILRNYTDGSVEMDRYKTDTEPAAVRKIGITWNFPSGLTKDKFIYTYDRFENTQWANILYGKDGLIFAEDAQISFDVNGTEMIVYFDDVTDHNYAEHYKITVTADGTTSKVYDVVGNYYKYYEQAQTYHIPLSDIPAGTSYTVEVKAYDFFDNVSLNSLVATAESQSELFHNKVESAMSATYTDISTKINYEQTAGSVASLEYYFRGEHLFSAGATLATVLNRDNMSLAEEFTVTDWSHGILTIKVKNGCDVPINVGLTVVANENGKEKWLTDFGAAHRYVVAADGQWAELQWDLYELFGITSLEQINAIRLKANSTAPNAEGYKLHLYVDDVDILQGEPVEVETPDTPAGVFEGGAFTAGAGLTLDLDNEQAVDKMTFDYTIESGDYFNIALMSDWGNWFGYFKFDANGAAETYPGVTTKQLENGAIRVYVDFAAVTTISNAPSNVLKIVYIRGNTTTANGTISNIRFNAAADSAPRGELVNTAEGKNIALSNSELLATVSFEYKLVEGTKFNMALATDWSNMYGYYAFGAKGAMNTYDGVTVEELEDGYFRVTFDMTALNKLQGTPNAVIDFVYIRAYDWSDAVCYLDNVSFTTYQADESFEGAAFTSGVGATIELRKETVNDQAVEYMTFDYTIENDGYFHVALMPDWSSFYGYFKFDANGVVGNYPGVSTVKLANGSIRAYFDMAALTYKNGAPSNVITMLYLRSGTDYITANGNLTNICINESAQRPPRGQTFTAGVDKSIDLATTAQLNTISFEYKIVEGSHFNIALLPNWSSYFGYFSFGTNGANGTYAGVTTEVLADGYIRVTFDMAALTVMSGTPSKAIDFLYIRGSWTEANGFIDNVTFA